MTQPTWNPMRQAFDQPPSLAEFLLARIGEDEAVARAAPPPPWTTDESECCVDHSGHDANRRVVEMSDAAEHIARWDPARVLADLAAQRKIVGEHMQRDDGGCYDCETPLCRFQLFLAEPYRDHPAYREEWRP